MGRIKKIDFEALVEMMQKTKTSTIENNGIEIERVLFNGPATIVFFKDGTKSVAKCRAGDVFDHEKGIAMAVMRKIYSRKEFKEVLEEAKKAELILEKEDYQPERWHMFSLKNLL